MKFFKLNLCVIFCVFILSGCSQDISNNDGLNINNKTITKNTTSDPSPVKSIQNETREEFQPLEVNLSNENLVKLNIFFSNFSEVALESFEKDKVSEDMLINFAVRHNVINNWNIIKKHDDFHGKIPKEIIEQTILKYFGKAFNNHKSTQEYKFENGNYILAYADGDTHDFSSVTKIIDNGNDYYTSFVNIYSPQVVDGYPENPYDSPNKWNMFEDTPIPELTWKATATIRKESDGRYILIDYNVSDIIAPSSIEQINSDKQISDLIFSCMSLNKSEIIKKLGNNYEIIATGAEATESGYCYRNLEFVIVFDGNEDESLVNYIYPLYERDIEINGAKNGMNFTQIQGILGKSPIFDTFVEIPEEKAYELKYIINGCTVEFFSRDKDGSNSSVTIYRSTERSLNRIEVNEHLTYRYSVDELKNQLIKSELKNGYIFEGKSSIYDLNNTFIKGRILKICENFGMDSLPPCRVVLTFNDGKLELYSDYDNSDFRYLWKHDNNVKLEDIQTLDLLIDKSDDETEYKIRLIYNNGTSKEIYTSNFKNPKTWVNLLNN